MSRDPTHRCKCLTWWAGLSSGTGKTLSHLSISSRVNLTERKRYRRHDGSHDFDTRAQDRRNRLGRSKPATWSKILSMSSCGILGIATVLVVELIQGVARGRGNERWALVVAWRSSDRPALRLHCQSMGRHEKEPQFQRLKLAPKSDA